jgi:hypothetical protein
MNQAFTCRHGYVEADSLRGPTALGMTPSLAAL